MIDYLSPGKIAVTDAISYGGLTPQEVKEAVLRLWLQPNDTWARGVLEEYVLFRPPGGLQWTRSLQGFDWIPAFKSRVMTRIARGIHRYDRYREPLLVFLVRDVTNAAKDLYATYARFQREEAERGCSTPPPPANPSLDDKASLEAAAEKLGIPEKERKAFARKLRALLKCLCRRREEGIPEPSISAMARALGVPPQKLEALMYAISTPLAEDAPWEEPPQGLEARAQACGIYAEGTENEDISGKKSALGVRQEGSPLNILTVVDKRFQDYLAKLGENKPCGERVNSSPRRATDTPDGRRVNPTGVQFVHMSEEELSRALEKLDGYKKGVAKYKDLVNPDTKGANGAREKKAEAPSDPSLPPVDAFANWFDETRTDTWEKKQRDMHVFLYIAYHLAQEKHGWQKLNQMYEEAYGEKPPVSAQKALYNKNIMPAFWEWLAENPRINSSHLDI